MTASVRPIFQNGQRLTAERLTQAIDYLQAQLKRVLLGVHGPGIGLGLELEPATPERADHLVVNPGVAIDGAGRLLIVAQRRVFGVQTIRAGGGADPRDGDLYRVRLVHEEARRPLDPCAPQRPLNVVERAVVEFEPETREGFRALRLAQAGQRAVDPWGLDAHPRSDGGVTLGHVKLFGSEAGVDLLSTTSMAREGMTAQIRTLADTEGHVALRLGRRLVAQAVRTNTAADLPKTERAMSVSVPASFDAPVTFAKAVAGPSVQATSIAPFGADFAAATVRGGAQVEGADGRVLEVGGGSGPVQRAGGMARSELGAGFAGVSAVPCEIVVNERAPDPVDTAGVPLELVLVDHDEPRVQVQRAIKDSAQIIGVSAGPQYAHPAEPERQVVPIATAGIVKVRVHKPSRRVVAVGANLVVHNEGALHVDDEGVVVARAAQRVESKLPAGHYDVYAWIVPAR